MMRGKGRLTVQHGNSDLEVKEGERSRVNFSEKKLPMLRTAVSSYSCLFLTLLTQQKDWTFRSFFLLLARCPHPQRLAVYCTASLLSLASLVLEGDLFLCNCVFCDPGKKGRSTERGGEPTSLPKERLG